MLKKWNKSLIFILALGLFLRLYGITHGFPFIYSVDEPAVVRAALGIRFDLNPGHFDWPHLHFYINYLLYMAYIYFRGLLQLLNLRSVFEPVFPLMWRDPLIFYFLTRVLNAVMGTFTCLLVYFAASKLFDKKAGYLAALALAIFPYHIHNSQLAHLDVALTFWFTLSLLFSVLIYKEGNLRWFMLAGVSAGLAASTKYNGAFATLIVLLAFLFLLHKEGLLGAQALKSRYTKYLLFAAAASIMGFFAGTPFALLDFDTFTRTDGPKGALWQFTNVGKVNLSTYLAQLKDALSFRFIYDFGVSFLILFEFYVLFCLLTKKTKEKLFILIPAVAYFLYITTFDKNRLHYYLPIFPIIAIMVGFFSKLILEIKNNKFINYLLLVLIFFPPLYISVMGSYIMARKDTRNIASEWLESNTLKTDLVIYSGSELDAIMEDPEFKSRKVPSLIGISANLGPKYLVVATKEAVETKTDFSAVKDLVKLDYYIDSQNRGGPNIYIYTISFGELN